MEFPRGPPSGGWDRTSRCHELQVTRICPGPQLRTARDIGSAGAPYPQPRALPGWPRAYREVWDLVGSGLRPCPQAEADSRPCVELKYGWGCGELPRPPTCRELALNPMPLGRCRAPQHLRVEPGCCAESGRAGSVPQTPGRLGQTRGRKERAGWERAKRFSTFP